MIEFVGICSVINFICCSEITCICCSAGGKFSIVGGANLQILNVTLEDDGVYTCRGKNLEEDVADAAATLSVKGQ